MKTPRRGGSRVRIETERDGAFLGTAELSERIDAALAGGAETLVLWGARAAGARSGAHPELLELVRRASKIAVEVDLSHLDLPLARSLAEAGARRVRVVVEGDGSAARGSLRALVESGLSPIAALAVGRRGRDPVVLARLVVEAAPRARVELWAEGVRASDARASDATSNEELGAEIEAVAQALGRTAAELVLAPERPVPPCLVPLGPLSRRLLATQLRAEGARNDVAPACTACALGTRCGLTDRDLRAHGGAAKACAIPDAAPYLRPGRSAGSRLRVLGDAEVATFFHVDYEFAAEAAPALPRDEGGELLATSRIGIIYRCNQVCTFCELADMESYLTKERVRAAIDAATARGSRRIILTGGEPTLSPELADHIAYCRERGAVRVELQTNAVLLDREGAAPRLFDAGLTHAQVSLHGMDPVLSDALTAAPGTHARTLRGVDALLRAGVSTLLNHLIFRGNVAQLVEFVDFADRRWGEFRERLTLQFHVPRNEFVTSDEAQRHLVRYRDLLPHLSAAVARARALGIATQDIGDPTGIPSLCLQGELATSITATGTHLHAWETEWMTRVAACERCAASRRCPGVPRRYLELFGAEEFRAIEPAT